MMGIEGRDESPMPTHESNGWEQDTFVVVVDGAIWLVVEILVLYFVGYLVVDNWEKDMSVLHFHNPRTKIVMVNTVIIPCLPHKHNSEYHSEVVV